MKLVWHAKISDVREKSLTVSGEKSADGDAALYVRSAGWWITIGQMSLYAGEDEPPFKRGDIVWLSIQHAKQEKEK